MNADGADRNDLNADDIASRSFTKARKGYESDEVRAYLVGLASVVRDWQRRHDDMERRLVEVERRAADPKDLDAEAVTQLLGEETARVLVDARKAANDIRSRVEAEVEATSAAAGEEATATRTAADEYAAGVRNLADEADEKIRSDADAYAARVRADVDTESLTKRTEADEYAASQRATADREVAELRAAVAIEVAELRSQAESVLAERTAEAEASAASIRADAEAHDATTRQEADAYAERTHTSADAYRSEVQATADTYRQEKITESDHLRAEAAVVAEQATLDADALLATRREEAQAEADRTVADAREQGRTMVQEARDYRERVIADLADRRRAARAQLEQLAATRDALAVQLTDVRTSIDVSHRSLQATVIDPASVVDLSADRRFLEASDAPSSSVGVGEIGEAPESDEVGEVEEANEPDEPDAVDEPTGPVAGDAPYDVEADGGVEDGDGDGDAGLDAAIDVEQPEWAPDETPGSESGEAAVLSGGGDDAPTPGEPATSEQDAVDVIESESGDESPTEPTQGDGDGSTETEPGVDDLFARIRAESASTSSRAPSGAAAAEVGHGDAPAVAETTGIVDVVDGPGDSIGSEEPSAETSGARGIEADAVTEPSDESTVAAGADEDEADSSDGDQVDPDTDLLDLRDATTNELERQLARKLKRVLSDEQNEALDLLRRAKGNPQASEVLPSEADHVERYRAAALEDLTGAERAGAGFYGDPPKKAADVFDLAGDFAGDMVRQIRGRLELSINGDGDEDEVAERIRALYREWKTQRIADVARHYVVAAFSRGVVEAAVDGTDFRWLVDHGDAAAPDCDDNALAGAVAKGSPFPTGDRLPPVHPGCRCLLVVVDE